MDSGLAAQIKAGKRLKTTVTNAPAVAGNAGGSGGAPTPSAPRVPGSAAASSSSSGAAPAPPSGPQLGGLFAGGMPTLKKTGAGVSTGVSQMSLSRSREQVAHQSRRAHGRQSRRVDRLWLRRAFHRLLLDLLSRLQLPPVSQDEGLPLESRRRRSVRGRRLPLRHHRHRAHSHALRRVCRIERALRRACLRACRRQRFRAAIRLALADQLHRQSLREAPITLERRLVVLHHRRRPADLQPQLQRLPVVLFRPQQQSVRTLRRADALQPAPPSRPVPAPAAPARSVPQPPTAPPPPPSRSNGAPVRAPPILPDRNVATPSPEPPARSVPTPPGRVVSSPAPPSRAPAPPPARTAPAAAGQRLSAPPPPPSSIRDAVTNVGRPRASSSVAPSPNGIARVPSPPLQFGTRSFQPSSMLPPPRTLPPGASSRKAYPSGNTRGSTTVL